MKDGSIVEGAKAIKRMRDAMIIYSFVPLVVMAASFIVFGHTSGIASDCAFGWTLLAVHFILLCVSVAFAVDRRLVVERYGRWGLWAVVAALSLGVVALLVDCRDCQTLSLVLYMFGQIAFVVGAKVGELLKLCHVAFYVIVWVCVMIGIYHRVTASIVAMAVVLYPMCSSYLAVRWASREFLNLQ